MATAIWGEKSLKNRFKNFKNGKNKMKTLFSIMVNFCGLLVIFDSAFAQTWIQSTNLPNQDWSGIASSSDGVKLIAVNYSDKQMYASTNSGVEWALLTNAPDVNWATVSSSADGSVIVGGGGYDFIYTSTNAGISWMSNNVQNYWVSVAVSADGTKIAAIDFNDAFIYASTNSGIYWASNSIVNSNNASSFGLARAICCSADGTKLVVATLGGTIFSSTNFGIDWMPTDAPVTNWSSVASSADGCRLAASCAGDGIYTSLDSGANWMLQTNAPNEDWYSIASSVDGSKLVAVAGGFVGGEPGPIYSSCDYGIKWTANDAPNTYWYSVTSSADGFKKAAVDSVSGIWTLQTMPSPQLNIAIANTNLALFWIIPSTNLVLQHSLDLVSWLNVTNSPTINFSNRQYQVTLSPKNNSSFFRLKSQ